MATDASVVAPVITHELLLLAQAAVQDAVEAAIAAAPESTPSGRDRYRLLVRLVVDAVRSPAVFDVPGAHRAAQRLMWHIKIVDAKLLAVDEMPPPKQASSVTGTAGATDAGLGPASRVKWEIYNDLEITLPGQVAPEAAPIAPPPLVPEPTPGVGLPRWLVDALGKEGCKAVDTHAA